jgi:hypothetical protein
MADEENKRATQRFIEQAWNAGRFDEAREHLAPAGPGAAPTPGRSAVSPRPDERSP